MCGASADGTAMVEAARSLLTAVTRVLLLADMVVVRQLLLAKDKVITDAKKVVGSIPSQRLQ